MIIVILLTCFLLNLINHGNILTGILNTLLLFLSILFYLKFSYQKLPSIKSLIFISPLLIFIAGIPIFTHSYNIFIVLLALGLFLLLLLYSGSNYKKILTFVILFYVLAASFYANGLIQLPFSPQIDRFIFSDDWIKLYINQMQNEALYIPYKIRLLVFNGSIYFYILLSKMASLFIFKNLYDLLLIANLYPLVQGIIIDLKDWNKSKTLIILPIFFISFITVVSRTIDIFNAFILLSPFFVYFILKGMPSINKIIYLLLYVFSLVMVFSPTQ